MSVDTEAYTRDLYGPGGPKYDPAFLDEDEDEDEDEDAVGGVRLGGSDEYSDSGFESED